MTGKITRISDKNRFYWKQMQLWGTETAALTGHLVPWDPINNWQRINKGENNCLENVNNWTENVNKCRGQQIVNVPMSISCGDWTWSQDSEWDSPD